MDLRHGIFLAPFHSLAENPTLCFERDLELVEMLDGLGFAEAWIGEHHSAGMEIDRLAGDLHRGGGGTHQAPALRHRRGVAAVPPPAQRGEPHHPARPHDARPDHVRRRPGPARVRRVDDGHRAGGHARPDGRGARRDPAPVPRRGGHGEDGVVHDARRARAPHAVHASAPRGLRRQRGHAVGRSARRQVRPRHAVRRRGRIGGLQRARHELGRRQRDRRRARSHHGPAVVCGSCSTCTLPTPRAGQGEHPLRYRGVRRTTSTTTCRGSTCPRASTPSIG